MNHSCLSFQYDVSRQWPTLRITLSALYAITSVTAVSLNSLILHSIWKNPTLHKPSYILLANLALTDLLYGAFAETLAILTHISYIIKWPLPEHYCYLTAITYITAYWLASLSLYILALISVDRLLAIRLKNRYRSFVTSRRIWMVTVPYWVGMFLLLMVLLLTNTFNHVRNVFTICFMFASLTTLTVCYSMAFFSLRKLTSLVTSSSTQQSQQLNTGSTNFDISRYRWSLNTMVLVMLMTLLLYLPSFGTNVVYAIENSKGFSSPISQRALLIVDLVVAINSSVNPLLYLWRIQDIRQTVTTTVKRILRQEHHPDQDEQN